jgi:hypothetical protein
MARLEEKDSRWIVEDKGEAGRNVSTGLINALVGSGLVLRCTGAVRFQYHAGQQLALDRKGRPALGLPAIAGAARCGQHVSYYNCDVSIRPKAVAAKATCGMAGGQSLADGSGGITLTTGPDVEVSGDAIVNNRKAKLIPSYELEIRGSWKGMPPSCNLSCCSWYSSMHGTGNALEATSVIITCRGGDRERRSGQRRGTLHAAIRGGRKC